MKLHPSIRSKKQRGGHWISVEWCQEWLGSLVALEIEFFAVGFLTAGNSKGFFQNGTGHQRGRQTPLPGWTPPSLSNHRPETSLSSSCCQDAVCPLVFCPREEALPPVSVEAGVVGRLELTPVSMREVLSKIQVKLFKGLLLHKQNANAGVVPRFSHGFTQITLKYLNVYTIPQ